MKNKAYKANFRSTNRFQFSQIEYKMQMNQMGIEKLDLSTYPKEEKWNLIRIFKIRMQLSQAPQHKP